MGSVVGYARLSTAEQAKGQSLEQQIARLKEAGAQEVTYDLMSGTSERRPRYRELLRRIKDGTVEKVISTRWDRLTRGATETCKLVDVFTADGAPELELLDDPTNLSTIGGRLQLRLLGVIAQAEVERIRERSSAGKAYRTAQGKIDVAPLGLLQEDGRLKIDRREFLCWLEDRQVRTRADLVREMFAALEESHSFQTPWQLMWVRYGWNLDRTSVQRLLLNPALRGARVGKRCKSLSIATWADVEEGAGGEALINPERHQKTEAVIRGLQARRNTPDKRRKHVLSGKVICGHCGRLMSRNTRTRGTSAYRCENRECGWYIPGKQKNSISETALFTAVFRAFRDQANALAALEEKQAQQADDALKTQPELLKLQAKRKHYLALMADGDSPELQPTVEQLDAQIAAIIQAGTNWEEAGMPSLAVLRQQAQLGLAHVELTQKLADGEAELGEEVVLHPPDGVEAVAEWWRAEYARLAGLKLDADLIQREIYEGIPELKDGGNPLKPEDYIEGPNPRVKVIRDLLKTISVSERQPATVELNIPPA